MNPILVVAAHPDDEVLGCGGTIARLGRTREVHTLILGEGFTSRLDSRPKTQPYEVAALKTAARAATKILGARSVAFEDLPDNRFDGVDLLDIVKRVERAIDKLRPDTIFTHHGGDLNIDHRRTFEAVLTATRPMKGNSVKDVFSFEIPSSTEWSFQSLSSPFKPSVFFEIHETFGKKIEALACYDKEIFPYPHPRSREALEAIARRWGSAAGMKAAEAFEMIRSLRD